ncbi:FMN-dependent dehydrogenase [Lipomyces arxii]|uniref:FMN-dependent dehydrogenase n=1 Tax=Lipomyces arxii TaxID=56418 RepID=UPI0034CE1736
MSVINIDDLEREAQVRANKMVWDFWAGGAVDLYTISDNKNAFLDYRIRPRYMRDVTSVSAAPHRLLLGTSYSIPCGLAPSSMHRLAHPDGELATARAAKSKNWPMAISSYSTFALEDAKAAGGENLIFLQLYVFKNRTTSQDLVHRAEVAGYKALLLTVDSPFIGLRYSDRRNSFQLPPGVEPGNFAGGRYAGPIDFAVEAKSTSRKSQVDTLSKEKEIKPNVVDSGLTWDDVKWLKSITKLEVWVKGVLTAEDAALAVDAGADGIWVSNHGGRQLDGCLPTLHALPEVVEAVKGRIPVHLDGGIRRGSDIFRAIALGADFVWIGRPVLWGLAYDGQKGVERAEEILEDEFKLTMALSGCVSVSDISKSYLTRRSTSLWSRL